MTTSPFADEFDAFSPFAPEATGLPVVSESPEQATVRQAVARGTTDLNALTNLVFFARHPERSGRGLSASEPGFAALGAEWTTIRDTVVRPLLSPTPSAPTTTADLWVPGAERVANAKSAGGTYVDGPWRFVFHTIEGEPSAQGFRTLAAGHGNPPHLWAMPSADLLLQTVPLHRSAYALARPGATMTNRLHAIQVECWGFAAKMGAATADTLNWLADRVLAPVARMVPINLDGLRPIGPGEPCYGTHSGCRMTAAEWQAFDGVCGHKDVPDNEHWDPGQLPIPTIAARAKATLGGTGSIRRESPVADLAGLSSHDGPNFVAERDDEDTESPWQQEAADVHPRLAWEAPSAEADPWAEFDHLAPAGFVPPVPARPPMTRRPSMFDRGCCLLVSRSLTGVDKLKDRWGTGTYDRSQPGTLYTGKAGFVDLAHLWSVAEVTAYAYQQIYAAGGKASTKVGALEGDATLRSTAPKTEWLGLARSIAYDDALAHEIAWYWKQVGGRPQLRLLPRGPLLQLPGHGGRRTRPALGQRHAEDHVRRRGGDPAPPPADVPGRPDRDRDQEGVRPDLAAVGRRDAGRGPPTRAEVPAAAQLLPRALARRPPQRRRRTRLDRRALHAHHQVRLPASLGLRPRGLHPADAEDQGRCDTAVQLRPAVRPTLSLGPG